MPEDFWTDHQAMFIVDSMRFLRWAYRQQGKSASIPSTPLNFYQAMRMEAYGENHGGSLFVSRAADGYNTFVWTVTEAGYAFMSEHGWTENEVEIPPQSRLYKDGRFHYPLYRRKPKSP